MYEHCTEDMSGQFNLSSASEMARLAGGVLDRPHVMRINMFCGG